MGKIVILGLSVIMFILTPHLALSDTKPFSENQAAASTNKDINSKIKLIHYDMQDMQKRISNMEAEIKQLKQEIILAY